MKIGVDAKWYFGGPPSGVRVIRNLVHSLLEYDQENEYFIFMDKKYKAKELDFKPNERVKVIYLWAGNNMLSNVFVLPFKANKFHLDVMLYQNFVSPFHRGKKIAYIFDVLFESFPQFFTKRERIYFFFIKYFAWFSNGIITLSETEKKRLVAFGYAPEERVHAIYIGVDDSFTTLNKHESYRVEQVKMKYNLPNNFLLYVGRLNTRKNIENLLRAMVLIDDKTIPLVIAGKEDWKQFDYKSLIEESGIKSRVLFTGWTEDSDLPIIYSLATIFCFPSYAEGFGLPPLEAMASGVPVIVSNTTSLPEICGSSAMYISAEKPEDIAVAISQLLSRKELREVKVIEGLKHVSQFKWKNTAAQFYSVFSSLKK